MLDPSLIRRGPTGYGVFECDREAPYAEILTPNRVEGPKKKIYTDVLFKVNALMSQFLIDFAVRNTKFYCLLSSLKDSDVSTLTSVLDIYPPFVSF